VVREAVVVRGAVVVREAVVVRDAVVVESSRPSQQYRLAPQNESWGHACPDWPQKIQRPSRSSVMERAPQMLLFVV